MLEYFGPWTERQKHSRSKQNVLDPFMEVKKKYFLSAITTLGDVGGPSEALYLAEYLERDDMTLPQRQALMRTLGQMCAIETWDKLVEIVNDEEETNPKMWQQHS